VSHAPLVKAGPIGWHQQFRERRRGSRRGGLSSRHGSSAIRATL